MLADVRLRQRPDNRAAARERVRHVGRDPCDAKRGGEASDRTAGDAVEGDEVRGADDDHGVVRTAGGRGPIGVRADRAGKHQAGVRAQ